jgi:hypothetical protein
MLSRAAVAAGSFDPATAVAVMIEIVEVTLTLSGRELPSSAYTSIPHQRRVEAELDRESGQRRVGDRLRNDDARGDRPSDQVRSQPGTTIATGPHAAGP